MVPPWVPPPPEEPKRISTPKIAPLRRFAQTRKNLGDFGRNGSRDDLRAGLGHYARSGLGGVSGGARRLAGTAHTAGALYGVLSALTSGTQLPPDVSIDVASLIGRSQAEIADIIVDALKPFDGTQDGEAARESVAQALSELLEGDENADLTALKPAQIDIVVESYLANDLARRIELDVGLSILTKAGPVEGVKRLDEMKRFIRQEVGRCMRERTENGEKLTRKNAATLSSRLLKDVLEIFESYL